MAIWCVRVNTLAVAPSSSTPGRYSATVEIGKADLYDNIKNKDLYFTYTGSDISIPDLEDEYSNSGKVYYKIGEDGTWSNDIPKFKDVGEYKLYYYVEGDENHNDLSSKEEPLYLNIEVGVSKDNWGTKVNNGGIINYVSKNGTTSAEVDKYGVIWLKEESDGTSAWYGLDNSQGIFKRGSKFWVRWLNKEKDKKEYDKYYEKLDEEHKRRAEVDKLWVFLTGVTDPDGNEYTNLDLDVRVPYYIQLGEDWDEGDVNALFISENEDESIDDIRFGTAKVLNEQFENINFPDTSGSYARLLLKHFSPYAVYDKVDTPQIDEKQNIGQKESKKISNEKSALARSANMKTGGGNTKTEYLITFFVLMIVGCKYLRLMCRRRMNVIDDNI